MSHRESCGEVSASLQCTALSWTDSLSLSHACCIIRLFPLLPPLPASRSRGLITVLLTHGFAAARLSAARLSAARLSAARLSAARLSAARLSAARLSAARLSAVTVCPRCHSIWSLSSFTIVCVPVCGQVVPAHHSRAGHLPVHSLAPRRRRLPPAARARATAAGASASEAAAAPATAAPGR